MKSILEVVRCWPSQKAKAWVESFVADVCSHPSVLAVVAFGAAVRTDRFTADVDLLVIYEHAKPRIEGRPIDVDIRWYERNKAESFIREGQELLGWIVHYGELLWERDDYWTKIREEWLDRMPFPSAGVADKRVERAWRLYRELIGMEDEDAAQEQRLVALTQEARARLIRLGVYPASRPELPGQLRAVKEAELAEKLEAALLDREQAAKAGGALTRDEEGKKGWRVRVARGQREHALPVIQQAYQQQQAYQGRKGAFVLVAQAHLSHAATYSDSGFYVVDRPEQSLRCGLGALAGFLAALEKQELDVITLVYIHIPQYMMVFSPRPDLETREAPDVLTGVAMFCTAVEQSGGDSGHTERQCEWVAISCDRIP